MVEDINGRSVKCLRCGTCCQSGGPALHDDDLHLIENDVLSFNHLVTIRRDEPAHNPLRDKVLPSAAEFVKIGGKGISWCCVFFEQDKMGCLIYQTRPLECRLLFCRDTSPVEEIMGHHLLDRWQLISGNDPVLALINRQEKEIPYRLVNQLLTGIEQDYESVRQQLTALVRRDIAIRDIFLHDFKMRQAEELFLFGRPLFLVLRPYGFRLTEKNGVVSLQ